MKDTKKSANKNLGVYHICPRYRNKTRIFIIGGIVFLLNLYFWLFDEERIGNTPLYILICISLLYKGIKFVHEWIYYWTPEINQLPAKRKKYTVDIFTTYCAGEPKEMIKTTLLAMKEIIYPHKNYLCDESADPELKLFCEKNQINYITRKEKKDAKAGNINNALKQSDGEICLVLDPDHIPQNNFLDRTIHHFNDENVGYVQSVQSYYNQKESLVAAAAAEQSYQFYGPLMMGMNSCNTVQVIGANCLFRRRALESIGGHAAGLAEDMHTGLLLQSKDWKGIYVPEVLSKGLVPETIKAYCEQQLKWTKGVFDLLFWIYPKQFKNLEIRQRFHYIFAGIYFSNGWISLLDLIIPLIALYIQDSGIQTNNKELIQHLIPLFTLSIIIRIRSQTYLMEEHEKGYQILGGILQLGSWYIQIKGLVLSILKRKLPYNPTKKNRENESVFKYTIPNLAIILSSIFIITSTIFKENNFNQLIMLCLATINMITLLAYIFLVKNIHLNFSKNKWIWFTEIEKKIKQLYRTKYIELKNGYWVVTIILFLTYTSFNIQNTVTEENYPMEKEQLILGSENTRKLESFAPDFLKTKMIWGEQEISNDKSNSTPLKLNFMELETKNNDGAATEIYKAIYLGYEKKNIMDLITKVQNNQSYYFINYFKNPKDDTTKKNEYINVIKFIHDEFQKNGISNVVWVWKYQNKNSPVFYPGDDYVDWIYFDEKNKSEVISEKEYMQARKWLLSKKKNIIINVNCPQVNGENNKLEENARYVLSYLNECPEIKCVVTKPELICSIKKQKRNNYEIHIPQKTNTNYKKEKNYGIKKEDNQFVLYSDGKPFYIKGIAYNPGHDWRDGDYSLSRKLIQKDFIEIKKTGANCIRIYQFEKNQVKILEEAEKNKLKVIPGIWFDPKIDYFKDSIKKKELILKTLKTIESYKDYPAVLGWSLGNETWGLLKKQFAKPYLFSVRAAYTEMIEKIAEAAHKIDTVHPVMTCIEHEESQITAEILYLKRYAPSLDIIGINSYYKNQISKLDSIFTSVDSSRPYLVSEFGPSGYWNNHYNTIVNNITQEESENEKMSWYMEQWSKYIIPYSGNNIGGIAYCWQDRMEGSLTWFGITDMKRRKKPVYFGLKKIWNNIYEKNILFSRIEMQQNPNKKKYIRFYCLNSIKIQEDVVIEWKICTEDFKEILHEKTKGNTIQIKQPEKAGKYRVYSYITYDSEKVSTASLGFVVQ